MDSIFLAAATVAGAMMRDHSAPPVEIARRAWDVTAALIAEGQARGYGDTGDTPPLFAAHTQTAGAGAGAEQPAQAEPNETPAPRRQRTGSAG